MITHDGGMLYAVATHLRDVWVNSEHQGLHPRADHCDEFPPCRPVGTLSDYLGVGSGKLEVVIEHWRDGARLPVLQWQPIEPAPFVGAGAGI